MVSAELITNSREQMLGTLSDLASVDAQRAYRDAVPFVHIPIELACQWDNVSRLLRDAAWFRDSLTDTELAAVLAFDTKFDGLMQSFGNDLPDLDILWADDRWTQLGLDASSTLEAFP